MRTAQDKPLVCKHCGTEITNDLYEEVQKEIQAEAGANLDPSVVNAFMKALNELRDFIGKIIVDTGHVA